MADDSDNYDSEISQDDDDFDAGDKDGGDFLQEDDGPVEPNLSASLVLGLQQEDLNKVMEYLGVKEQHARMLLMYHRWHVDRIFNLLEKGMEQMFLEVGVMISQSGGAVVPA